VADSSCQRGAEKWIRESWLPIKFGQAFTKQRLRLTSGGFFEFDAVSADGKMAVAISTCGGVTAGGNKATSKLHKIRADALFLIMADVERKVLAFSCPKMHALCEVELRSGRLPGSLEMLLAELPANLETALVAARLVAAREVTPVT
jgi:hypothetical protein